MYTQRKAAVIAARAIVALAFVTVPAQSPAFADDPARVKPQKELVAHTGAILEIAFSSDGRWLCSASHDRTVRVWDTKAGKAVGKLQANSQLWSVAVDPKRRYIAAAGDGTVHIWRFDKKLSHAKNLSMTAKDSVIGARPAVIQALAFSPDGRFLIAGGDTEAISMWTVGKWKALEALNGHTKMSNSGDAAMGFLDVAQVQFLSYSPDGKRILSGGKTQAFRLWGYDRAAKSWTTVAEFPEPPAPEWPAHRMTGCISPDGKTAAVGGTDGALHLVDVKEGKLRKKLKIASGTFLHSVAFRPDSKKVYGLTKKLVIIDAKSAETDREIDLPGPGTALAVSAGGTVAVAGDDHIIRLYEFKE